MLRTFIVVGIAAGISAALPALYERNPEAAGALLRGVLGTSEAPQEAQPVRLQSVAVPEPGSLGGRKVRLEADERGHFVSEFRLNGRAVEALVDTGATVVAINRSTARRIGLNLMPSDFVHEVNTANGKTRAAGAVIERMRIGRIEVENVEAAVLEDEALRTTLVGMSFLRRLGRFEVQDGELLLEQ